MVYLNVGVEVTGPGFTQHYPDVHRHIDITPLPIPIQQCPSVFELTVVKGESQLCSAALVEKKK